MANPFTILGGIGTGVGLFNTLFGEDPEDQLKKSIKKLFKQSNKRFQSLEMTTKGRIGAETSAERSSATNRLLRQGVAPQVVEQIMGDISTRGGRRQDEALANLRAQQEQLRMSALSRAGSLAAQQARFDPTAGLAESLSALGGLFGGNILEDVQRVFPTFDDPIPGGFGQVPTTDIFKLSLPKIR